MRISDWSSDVCSSDLEGPEEPVRQLRQAAAPMQSKVKRFYKLARAAPAPESSGQGGYAVLVDGRPVRTPAKALLILPTEQLAAAIAAVWKGQGEEDRKGKRLNFSH